MTDTYDKIQKEIKDLLLDNPNKTSWIDLQNLVLEKVIKLLLKLKILEYVEKD